MSYKPLIAVSSLFDEEKNSIWMLPGYHDLLIACGAIPIDVPFNISREDIWQLIDMCDGLLLTGGQDVSPALYNEKQIKECGVPSDLRDKQDHLLLKTALEQNKPILGICRGIQFINAYFGGTLYQDLPSQYSTKICHSMSAPYNRVQHRVHVLDGTPLAKVVGEGSWGVNSYHHQAVKQLAPSLKPMAKSEDGLIEAVYHPSYPFLWALQWHPELSWETDEKQYAIGKAFIEAVLG